MRRLLLLAFLIGCASQPADPVKPEEEPGLPHHRRWSERIGQGGQPQGEAAFARLKALGYSTILSVDGMTPDVEAAERHGLRYVHVPIGYDGIEPEAATQIVKAVRDSGGPVYIHCHHGLHRCAAGTGVARIAVDGVSTDQALADMRRTCSPKYAGLYRSIEGFRPPDEATLAETPAAPSEVVPEGFLARMLAVSETWDRLQACREAGFKAPADEPDLDPAHEALILTEGFRELSRSEEAERLGAELMALLGASEAAAAGLEEALRNDDGAAAEAAFQRSRRGCAACHADYRN